MSLNVHQAQDPVLCALRCTHIRLPHNAVSPRSVSLLALPTISRCCVLRAVGESPSRSVRAGTLLLSPKAQGVLCACGEVVKGHFNTVPGAPSEVDVGTYLHTLTGKYVQLHSCSYAAVLCTVLEPRRVFMMGRSDPAGGSRLSNIAVFTLTWRTYTVLARILGWCMKVSDFLTNSY